MIKRKNNVSMVTLKKIFPFWKYLSQLEQKEMEGNMKANLKK